MSCQVECCQDSNQGKATEIANEVKETIIEELIIAVNAKREEQTA